MCRNDKRPRLYFFLCTAEKEREREKHEGDERETFLSWFFYPCVSYSKGEKEGVKAPSTATRPYIHTLKWQNRGETTLSFSMEHGSADCSGWYPPPTEKKRNAQELHARGEKQHRKSNSLPVSRRVFSSSEYTFPTFFLSPCFFKSYHSIPVLERLGTEDKKAFPLFILHALNMV